MPLSRYHEKRDFKITPEPRGRIIRGQQKGLLYLIQKHAARTLHYDFRLELGGVLLSWAIPKGPSLNPSHKRLAMHVEDHPLQYGDFEGVIPKGQYGAGAVMLWDQGTWNPVGDPRAAYQSGHLKFDLNGRRLRGRWALIKTRGNRYGGKGEAWLLIKDIDDYSNRSLDANIVETEPNSVTSGRNIEEIADDQDRQWHSLTPKRRLAAKQKPTIQKKKEGKPDNNTLARTRGAKLSPLPEMLLPTLATLVDMPPSGDDWIHELKYDGYRMLTRLNKGKARLYSRTGKDWSAKFPSIVSDLKGIKAKTAWIDGEICAVDANGHSNFQALQNMLSDSIETQLFYFAFDVLYLDGIDLRDVVLTDRKRILKTLLEQPVTAIRLSPEARGNGVSLLQKTCKKRFEGIVSKRADSIYATGLRTRNWVKVKCLLRQEMVIGGYTDPQGHREGFGALLLGVYDNGNLLYSGKVGTGFDARILTSLHRRLARIEQKTPPFIIPPRGFSTKGVHWVEPKLVAEVEFTEWSEGGALRHPSFIALREDKIVTDVIREEAVSIDIDKIPMKRRRRILDNKDYITDTQTFVGVGISHADKAYFPEASISKRDVAAYYEAVSERMLPYIDQRPLSFLRCPDGWNKECFYQKHAEPSVHVSVRRVEVPHSSGKATYFSADSPQALIGLVQWGVIELHPWASRFPNLDRPDRLIFDFDPADGVSWARLVEAVHLLRSLLEEVGLTGFLKTTGGKGLHVVVPIHATLTWVDAKAFAKSIAILFARTFPEKFTATMTKSKRKGRIFIDYLRNGEGATAIAPYSIRARKNAPVSMPISWKELNKDKRYDYFNITTALQRLKRQQEDPWQAFLTTRQTVTLKMFENVGSTYSFEKKSLSVKSGKRKYS